MKSFSIPFDHIKLALSCAVYLIIFMAMPVICLYISLDPLFIFFLLTICWFTLKAAIRAFKRLVKNKAICICTEQEIQINSLSDKTNSMRWKDIEKVTWVQKHHSLQFVLSGEHIDHASGVYMIHIDYPFISKNLESVKQQLLNCFEKHHIPTERMEREKKKEVSLDV